MSEANCRNSLPREIQFVFTIVTWASYAHVISLGLLRPNY